MNSLGTGYSELVFRFFLNENPERLGMEIEFVHVGTNSMANLGHHMDFFHCLILALLYHGY